jgi:NADPH2:quinone reductase
MNGSKDYHSGGSMATRIEFHKHGGPEVLQAVEFNPTDPAENEVQVENKAIGINYIDTYIRSGLYPPRHCRVAWGPRRRAWSAKWVLASNMSKRAIAWCTPNPGLVPTAPCNVLADKVAILPNAISFEQAAASFLKGLTVFYLLRKTYEIKPDEAFLFHAAAGGVGLIACQWAKALGAKLIGTVGSARKHSGPYRLAHGR